MNILPFAKHRAGLATVLTCMAFSCNAIGVERYVYLSSTNPISPFTNWSTAATSIQTAVNAAASGDTVRIAAGDYYEQVLVSYKTNLTLAGDPGAILHALRGMSGTLRKYGDYPDYPVLGAYRSDVVLSGLTIDGEYLGELYSNRLLGVYLLGSGGTVTNCTVKGFRASTLERFTDAVALQALNPMQTGASAVNIGIVNSTFVDNNHSLLLRGDPVQNPTLLRITVAIKRNTISGLAGPNPHYGIWIVTGVGGEVAGNLLMNHGFTGTGLNFCSAINAYDAKGGRPFVPLKAIRYEGNTFSNNSGGLVMVRGDNSQVINNVFIGTNGPSWGALAVSGANVLVADNNFADASKGILLLGDESFGDGWPAMVRAVNPLLANNWFYNVPTPVQINPLVTGLQQRGTDTKYPFAPRFQSFTRSSAGEVVAVLRAWHGQTVMLESSTNLVDWVPEHIHFMVLPQDECRRMTADTAPQRFYRLVRQ